MLEKTSSAVDLTQSLANGVIVPDPYTLAQMKRREREMRTPGVSKSKLLMQGITPSGVTLQNAISGRISALY